ncbi:MAG: hypothetical protein C0483_24685 [Pirellula sp.]|nr:hypothetical protein [Pirellula sp.]
MIRFERFGSAVAVAIASSSLFIVMLIAAHNRAADSAPTEGPVRVEPFFLRGSIPAKLRSGNPIPWTFSLKNLTSETKEIGAWAEMAGGLKVRLINRTTGRECKLSQSGNYFLGDNLQVTAFAFIRLQPGAEYTWNTNLLNYFEDIQPGHYELQTRLSHFSPDFQPSKSAFSLAFEVTP